MYLFDLHQFYNNVLLYIAFGRRLADPGAPASPFSEACGQRSQKPRTPRRQT
jgi:hypothetical protein